MSADSHTNRRVGAVLGPTNTGKTYYAVERMLAHKSGMIGFPLRLLARENYDRIVAVKGRAAVALVTGEEKITPPGAVYHVCTVEAMPPIPVDFLAVDEIQLAADPGRGHVFTNRLLHWRGRSETLFLGAQTAEHLIRRLVPKIKIISRPRFSRLNHAGLRKLTRLPRRSAVVAFSVDAVYALAERLRAAAGGAAVVLGALSPSARNAQAAMFQSGEVDYLVATDAIGMGLNMDLDHVAFAALRKFDGKRMRALTTPELAQIAGRAGRHTRDGTFGTISRLGPMDPAVAADIEDHQFDPLPFLWWRNADLDLSSPRDLIASLDRPPPERFAGILRRTPPSSDRLILDALAGQPEIAQRARTPEDIGLLWEVCRIPDYRKSFGGEHHRLLSRIYTHLADADGLLPAQWLSQQVERLDRIDGGIDMLAARIAHIRIWNYVSSQGRWLADPEHWRARTREIEDRLSESLHQALVRRFVDSRTALVSRLAEGGDWIGAVKQDGQVLVEGQRIGRLDGLRFKADDFGSRQGGRLVLKAARSALESEMARRAGRLSRDGDDAFALDLDGRIRWLGETVARLQPGASLLTPGVDVTGDEFLAVADREQVRRRLADWLAADLKKRLAPLWLPDFPDLSPAGRGLVFRLQEALGSMPRAAAVDLITALSRPDRRRLRRAGLVIGRQSVFLPDLLRPPVIALRALLWRAGQPRTVTSADLPPPEAAVTRAVWPPGYAETVGYRFIPSNKTGRAAPEGWQAGVAVRADRLEQMAAEAWRCGRQGSFIAGPNLLVLAGGDATALRAILRAAGVRARKHKGVWRYSLRPAGRKPKKTAVRKRAEVRPDSPFAALGRLNGAS